MALGRGLGDILTEVENAYEKDLSDIDKFSLESESDQIAEIDVNEISPNPFQPRKHFDDSSLKELSESIVRNGLLQPIVVIKSENGYTLIAGERRLRAHKLANIEQIKAVIADVDLEEVKLRELALLENIQRENLNAIELANSYKELLDVHNITHDELSNIVHKSRSQITNTMRLLSLSTYAQEQLQDSKISQGHAKVLIGLDAKKQKVIIDSVVGQKLSVRDTENMVKKYKNDENEKKTIKSSPSLLSEYSQELSTVLPLKHKIKAKSLEIYFENETQVESFMELLKSVNDKKPGGLLNRILN
ncbi:MAG: Chromosome (plasmid) partitioning protein ParB [uncultured Sulfurovum sp.]|uniref:Chromosome (Plasmid) partitioning protein ParB n=1 Tax=uncultured Sulfurovum sp. TaxID=269237 RepID=A0A6S6S769_9BACT|nr:MAG: Chromosome (plasmid) partitioning protein ParB [uncultured Sulfurovum sp.]